VVEPPAVCRDQLGHIGELGGVDPQQRDVFLGPEPAAQRREHAADRGLLQ
jgi:hypothetical protein